MAGWCPLGLASSWPLNLRPWRTLSLFLSRRVAAQTSEPTAPLHQHNACQHKRDALCLPLICDSPTHAFAAANFVAFCSSATAAKLTTPPITTSPSAEPPKPPFVVPQAPTHPLQSLSCRTCYAMNPPNCGTHYPSNAWHSRRPVSPGVTCALGCVFQPSFPLQ